MVDTARGGPVEITYLADQPAVIPTLARWFRAQWPAYYAARAQAEIEQDFQTEARYVGLPIRLVAFEAGALAGTIVLRQHAMSAFPAFQPGLGGLLVAEAYRRRGIGARLIQSGMEVAQAQGYGVVYTATATADAILTRLGWQRVQTLTHGDEQLGLYQIALPSQR